MSKCKKSECQERSIERRSVIELKPHPKQKDFFDDVPDGALEELQNNIKQNGLLQPIEILPDGTIVCGHQRLRAVIALGWKDVDCWVRHDIAQTGADAVEKRFLEDNVNRRQLSKLSVARCYVRLRELEKGKQQRNSDLRDYIGEKLGMTGRHLDRLAKILEAPRAVQQAFEKGELPLVMAESVARLPERQQQEIVKRITAGEPAKKAVGQLVAGKQAPKAAYKSLLSQLRRACVGLMGETDRVAVTEGHLKILEQGAQLIADLKRRAAGK